MEPSVVGTARQPDTGSDINARLGAVGITKPPGLKRIGVVFVHGIGSQKPGDTIFTWARPLLDLIAAWAATTPGVAPANDPVRASNVDTSGASRPFILASVPAGPAGTPHAAQEWLMTEAWWATRVVPPSVGEMFGWLYPFEMVRLIKGIFLGISSESRFLAGFDALFLWLCVLPGSLLVLLVYALFRLLRLVPIPAVRDFAAVRAIEFFLVDWFGDVRILLSDRAQAANIRARVAEALAALKDAECDTLVVIGHSGGTIVGYMTLADPTYAHIPVRRFITHGQALTIAWRLGHADEYSVPDRRIDRLYRGDRLRHLLGTVPARPGLVWHDFWATHDPAPGGGFSQGPAVATPSVVGGGESIKVFNRMSLVNDHGGYWDNTEGFTLPVARLIESAPDAAPPTTRFFPIPGADPDPRIEQRERRVKLLQFMWVGLMATWVAGLVVALIDPLLPDDRGTIGDAGRVAWELLDRVEGPLTSLAGFFGVAFSIEPISGAFATLVGLGVLSAFFYLVGLAISRTWTGWDRRERQIALQPMPLWRPTWPLTIGLGLCVVGAAVLIGFGASGSYLFVAAALAFALLGWLLVRVAPKGCVQRTTAAEVV